MLATLKPGGWSISACLTAAFMLAPIVGIAVLAFGPMGEMLQLGEPGTSADAADNIWPHLIQTVLPEQICQTLGLMTGVAALTLLAGVPTAWLVTFYRFPGSRLLEWMLLLPLAIPTYIAAYSLSELLDKAGPFYAVWKQLFGSGAWYPQLHSLGGAIVTLSLVLYPYVYLAARTSFLQQSALMLEAGRNLGASPTSNFWRIALPLARPAIIVGVSLALMECLNDIGAVEHLGVQTLTVGVYDTWLSRGSLAGAAQLALLLLGFMGLLVLLERYHRARQTQPAGRDKPQGLSRRKPPLLRQGLYFVICALPVVFGFILPCGLLVSFAVQGHHDIGGFLPAAQNSFMLAGAAALLTVLLGLMLAYGIRVEKSRRLRFISQSAALGYAVPGTVLGLGVIIILLRLDDALYALFPHGVMGVELVLGGTVAGLLIAYVIRFLALSFGALEAAFGRVSESLDMAAASLGKSRMAILWQVHIPILRPALLAAMVLVFVDTLKELPATLILRPFDFETLATQVYNYASIGQIEEAALPALMIIVAGLGPVIIALGLSRRK